MLKTYNLRNSELILILAFLTLLVYSNALSNGFLWDDGPFILENPLIRNFKHIPDFFFKNLSSVAVVGSGFDAFYRPLFLTSFTLDYYLWRLNPLFSHLVNVLLHIFNVILIFILILKLSKNRFLAFLTSLLFSLHPIHVEAVTPVFNRMDALVTSFILLAIIMYIKSSRNNGNYFIFYNFLTLLLFSLGLLAKEFAIVLPIIFIVYDYLYVYDCKLKGLLKRKYFYAACVFICSLYFYLRISVLGADFIGFSKKLRFTSFYYPEYAFWKISIIFQTIFEYLKILIVPNNLSVLFRIPIKPIWHIEIIATFLISVLMIFFLCSFRRKNREASFFICWFFVFLFPVANILSIGNHISEHYIYLSSLAFCFFLALLLFSVWRRDAGPLNSSTKKKLIVLVAFFICFYYSYRTILRNYDWKHEVVLWKKEVQSRPNHPVAHVNLGVVYSSQGLYAKAIEEYKTAIALEPRDYIAWHALGVTLTMLNNFDDGIEAFNHALRLNPDNPVIYNNLGKTYNIMGKFNLSIDNHNKSIKINPNFFPAYYDLGIAYFNNNNYDKALEEFNTLLQFEPRYFEAYYGIGLVLEKQGKKDEAIKMFKKVFEFDPHYTRAMFKLIELSKQKTK